MEAATPLPLPHAIARSERTARFEAFVSAHRDRAVRVAWRLVGEDLATAEEVAQDAFVRAWSALPRFREDAALSTWFYRVLVRQASNRRRWLAVRRRWAPFLVKEEASHAPLPDGALQERIRSAVDRLSQGQREIFTLVHLEGFTLAQAAELTGRAPGTAKSHLHRALESLRADLSDLSMEHQP